MRFSGTLGGALMVLLIACLDSLPVVADAPFEQVDIPGLTGVTLGSVSWGDFDSDGRLDFLISGYNGAEVSQIWRNTGSGFTNVTSAVAPNLPQVDSSSAAWGDYDNDGRLDFLLAGYWVGNNVRAQISQLWRNTGDGFTNVPIAGLPGVEHGSVAWADFDNDGRLDFLITGYGHNDLVSQLWRNTGGGFTNVPIPGLPKAFDGAVAWGDYDNDGWLDFLVAGASIYWPVSQLWRNVGGAFTNVTITVAPGLPQLDHSAAAWGDFDNDGQLDFLLTGDDWTNLVSQLWGNTDSGFTNVPIGNLPRVGFGSLAWGDFDSDGSLDFLMTGYSFPTPWGTVLQLWRNTAGGFTNIPIPDLPADIEGPVAWADYDNDSRLDFLIAGNWITQVWRNSGNFSNAPPTAPSGLNATISGDFVTLTWNAPADDHTPAAGLSYNVRVGSAPGASDVVSPMSLPNGFRLLPEPGNAHGRKRILRLASGRTYHWSVQAVDGGFAGSPFAGEEQFTTPPLLAEPELLQDGRFQFSFSNHSSLIYQVLATTNAALPLAEWELLGLPDSVGGGQFRFMDALAPSHPGRFYVLRPEL